MAKKTFELDDLKEVAESSGFKRGESNAVTESDLKEVQNTLEGEGAEESSPKPAPKKVTAKKARPPKAKVAPAEDFETDTVTIQKVALPKAATKADWTKVSFLIPPDVARAVAFLMQSRESRTPKAQHVFEEYAFDGVLEAAKALGFNPDQ